MAIEDEFDPRAERIRSENKNKNTYEAWIKTLAKDEGKSEEAFMKLLLHETAKKMVGKYKLLWAQEAAAKAKIMQDCVREHHAPPDNYYIAEHKALVKYNNALTFLAAIEEG